MARGYEVTIVGYGKLEGKVQREVRPFGNGKKPYVKLTQDGEDAIVKEMNAQASNYQELLRGMLLISFTAAIADKKFEPEEIIGLIPPDKFDEFRFGRLDLSTIVPFDDKKHSDAVAAEINRLYADSKKKK